MRLKIPPEKIFMDIDATLGFNEVEEFNGHTVTVRIEKLLAVMKILKGMKKAGFSEIRVGVENNSPLCFFLDKTSKIALLVAPIAEDGDEP